MHTTINYTNSPDKAFDAIEDIKSWLGQTKWDELYPQMALVTNQRHFIFYCSLAGIQGYPVIAWWELIHGQGSWKDGEE